MYFNKGINMKKRAFTMAEAILTMTILGVIAAIMIANLKPVQYRNEGFKTTIKKVSPKTTGVQHPKPVTTPHSTRKIKLVISL